MATWPTFTQTIVGWNLLKFIEWVKASDRLLNNPSPSNGMPILMLPPVQRTEVWRPKQVVELWDSLLRGLPIGMFYLVERSGFWTAVSPLRGQITQVEGGGFELLDGQQRVRALLAGTRPTFDNRCLWVDLGADRADQRPCLLMTSKAQPFGYDAATGRKLNIDDRRNARAKLEPDPENDPVILVSEDGTSRRAYDLELFDGPVKKRGEPIVQPPLPYRASAHTFKLCELLAAWQEGGFDSLSHATGSAPPGAVIALEKAFETLEQAEIALLRVDPNALDSNSLLALFERIGAGGTPLSAEERLFSIYKHHVPKLRSVVDEIYNDAGRLLPPTKIAATALRIANANKEEPSYSVPDVGVFAKEMAENLPGGLRDKLEFLLPTRGERNHVSGPLHSSFVNVKKLLSYSKSAGAYWIPDVLLASLPTGLWQALVFWASRSPDRENLDASRQEMVRLALFWHLFVWNDDKAASWCFDYIGTNGELALFPGNALYRRLSGIERDDACAHQLISASEFTRRLSLEETALWRTDKERFEVETDRNHIGSHWWWYGGKILPWLQRDYIKREFPGYFPLTDHEDDVPYDVDHICPKKDWGDDRRHMRRRFDGNDRFEERMYGGRDATGNGIGNLRLIETSLNRQEQDADVAKKMRFILRNGPPEKCDAEAMTDWAFTPEHREFWKRVSRPGEVAERPWDEDRLKAFQHAVEQRAAWLYQRFHNDLDYRLWTSKEAASASGE